MNSHNLFLSQIPLIRKKVKITQKKLEKLSGVRQEVITRLETGTSDPQLSTILKIITPLGYSLKLVKQK
jgi:predicted transcriptional regulator